MSGGGYNMVQGGGMGSQPMAPTGGGVAPPALNYGQPPGMAQGPWDGMRKPLGMAQGPWDEMRRPLDSTQEGMPLPWQQPGAGIGQGMPAGGGPGYSLTGAGEGGRRGGGLDQRLYGATTNPVGAMPDAGIGGSGLLGGRQSGDAYADYTNRRNDWINELRRNVAQPMQPGAGTQPAPGAPPRTPGPPAGQSPGAVPNQLETFKSLYAQDPRLAYGYTFGEKAQPWFVQNQQLLRDQMFGGDQSAFNSWINSSSYANPLSLQERLRLQQAAGY